MRLGQSGNPASKQKDSNTGYAIWDPRGWNPNTVIAIVTTIYALVAIFQLGAIRRQTSLTGEIRDSNRDAVKAASENAIAARANAEASTRYVEAFLKAERPWLEVSNFRLVELVVAKPLEVHYVVKNRGRSVASLVEMQVVVKCAAELPPEPSYLAQRTKPDAPLNLASQETYPASANMEYLITAEEVENIKAGRVFLWTHGYLRYLDPWDREKTHELRFCRKYWFNRPPQMAQVPHPAGQQIWEISGPEKYFTDT